MCTNDNPDCVEPTCPTGEGVDPIEGCECITFEEYEALMFAAEGLGPDCIADTEDDPSNPEPCEEYPWGYAYNADYCQCTATRECDDFVGCGLGEVLSPIDLCSCITQEDLDAIVEDAQQYGPDCIPGTPDDDDNDVGDDDCDEGYKYDYDICQCVVKFPDCVEPVCGLGE